MNSNNSNNDLHQKLMEIIECENTPSYTKVIALAMIETRKELCYLKKLNKWQIGLIVSILITILGLMFR